MSLRFRSLPLLLGALVTLTSLAPSAVVGAEPTGVEQLAQQLTARDFRVQVQAALILGKTGDARALPALSAALRASSVAVRAAAAAGLQTLGDPAALPALRRSAADAHPAVRRRIAAAIQALELLQRSQLVARRQAKVLVKLSGFAGPSGGDPSLEALGAAAHTSRRVLEGIPRVAVLNASEEAAAAAARHRTPVVVMRPSLRQLSSRKKGDQTVVVANVEFLVESHPGSNIIGRFSGHATAESLTESGAERVQLQKEAVGAAVSRALESGAPALLSVAGRS